MKILLDVKVIISDIIPRDAWLRYIHKVFAIDEAKLQ